MGPPPPDSLDGQKHHRRPTEVRELPGVASGRRSNARLNIRRSRHAINVGICFLFSFIFEAPTNTLLSLASGVGMVVDAAPCLSAASSMLAAGEAQLVIVAPGAASNITTMFDCEDGNFEVFWSGAVNVSGTIVIGKRTTVTITGDSATSGFPVDDTTSSSGSASAGARNSSLSNDDHLAQLRTSMLSLPSGLSSEVVGVGPPDKSALNHTVAFSSPLFYVDGGNLTMRDFIVRDGYAVNANNSDDSKGAGVFAVNAKINITRCEFSNNFAAVSGGGIYAEESTVVVVDSVFAGCRAGFQSVSGDDEAPGVGGAISAKNSDVLVDGCLFKSNYAGNKGGAIHHEDKHISVVGSVFTDSKAGSQSEDEKAPKGQGSDLSLAECAGSFDGEAPCQVNDTAFANGYAGSKGGSVLLSGGADSYTVEFHRCSVENSSVGFAFKDDPQGEGGGFSVGERVTLLLSDCVVKGNSCGKKGGVLVLSSDESLDDSGATVIMRNSSFESNSANLDSGGVVNMADFTTAVVEGNDNVFDGNECYGDGAVFAASADSSITIEGGLFINNHVEESGAVIWSKGALLIVDGNFTNNHSPENGGVLFASEFSNFTLAGGHFQGNEAQDGGILNAIVDSIVHVDGGVYSGNVASSKGGVFSLLDGAHLQITGGNFSNNKADFGGFLYREGTGNTSCEGASILQHDAVDGGAIYAIDDATVNWACDIRENSVISASAIYARENTKVVLQDMSLVDNSVSRGSVIVLITSQLETFQVEFSDSSMSPELSAVQVNEDSTFMAEETYFTGFASEAVVFSEGNLFLDNCDFSGSTSSVLVYSETNSTAVIRNAVLGNKNYVALAEASSRAGELPNANSFTNAKHTCQVDVQSESGEIGEASTASSVRHVCSETSACLEGDLGVYCECYYPQRTIDSSNQERCISAYTTKLDLRLERGPGDTFFPQLVEGDIRLWYDTESDQVEAYSSASDTGDIGTSDGSFSANGPRGGVVWTVQALNQTSLLDWTVFPSSGLLLPNQSISLRVVTAPEDLFDGTANATFGAMDFRLDPDTSSATVTGGDDNVTENPSAGDGVMATVLMEVTYYHCASGSFWNLTQAAKADTHSSHGGCKLCTEEMDGTPEGVDCSGAGATIEALPIRAGYWRATTDAVFIRECSNENACTGGTVVQGVDDYCGEGYGGPQCAVCSPGFGRGSANTCHTCSQGFKIGMYFLVVVSALITLIVVALLSVYLIGGKDAVSSTVTSTKKTILTVKRRGVGIAVRSGDNRGSVGFGPLHDRSGRSTRFGLDRSKRIGGKSPSPQNIDTAPRGAGNGNLIGNAATGELGSQANTPNKIGGRGGVGIRRQSRLKRMVVGVSGFFGNSRSGKKTTPGKPSVDAGSAPEFGNNSQGRPGSTFGAAYGGEGGEARGRSAIVGQQQGRPTAATRIGQTLSVLPLSKVKIVIVVWQISSAFADVTNAAFPPIYEKFLSVIGVFSLDLGWVLSAACLATDLTFYDKLLVVTIGPIFLLGLLGITFFIGSRSRTPTVADQPVIRNHSWASTAADVSTRDPTFLRDRLRSDPGAAPDHPPAASAGVRGSGAPRAVSAEASNGREVSWIIHASEGAVKPNETAPASQVPVRQPILGSPQSLRKRWQAGPGNESNPEQSQLWGLFSRHTTMTLIILYLVYSQVSTVVFQTFSCEPYDEIDKSYLRADNRIECNTGTHKAYKRYALFMICVYPLGIPAAFAFLLVRQRVSLNPPTDKRLEANKGRENVVQKKIEQRRMDEMVTPTSFLWSAYYPNRYYFEVFECMRRLLLTGVLVFVQDTSEQVAYGCIFAFISLWAFELQRPHIDGLEIQLYRTGCLVIFFTNFLALIIQAKLAQPDSRGTAVYSVVLILVHVLFILSICWNSWVTMQATFSRRHVQGMFFGVDVVDEETADNILGPESEKKYNASAGGVADFKVEDDEMVPAWQTEGVAKPPAFDANNTS